MKKRSCFLLALLMVFNILVPGIGTNLSYAKDMANNKNISEKKQNFSSNKAEINTKKDVKTEDKKEGKSTEKNMPAVLSSEKNKEEMANATGKTSEKKVNKVEKNNNIDKMLNNEIFALSRNVRGGELKANVSITRFNIYKFKHQLGDPPVTKLYSADQFDLELDWDASSYGNSIKENDYFEVQLPTQMQFPLSGSATQFDLVDTSGTVVAKGKINAVNGGGGKIVVTFTKSVEGLYNVKGTMKLEASFVSSKIKTDANNTFTITVNGKPITHTIHIDKPGTLDGETLAKYAYDPDKAEQKVQWVVRINLSKGLNLQHTFISDELSPAGAKYLDGTIVLKEVEYDNIGKVTKVIKEYSQAELNSMIKFNGDKSSFTLNIGSPGKKSFQLRYQTTYPDDKIVNKVILKGDGIHKEYHGGFNSASSSGTGEGNKGKVKIVKVDAIDPNIKLPQAKFEIRVKDTDELIETMVTGDNGEAISKTTLNPIKKYVLKEISTPPGYQVESTSETTNPTSTKPKKDVFDSSAPQVSIDGEIVKAGQELLYKVTYKNTTGKDQKVEIKDAIPEHTTYVEGSADNDGVYKDGEITWTKEKVAADETFEVTFKVKVKDDVNGGTIKNKANVLEGNNKFETNETTNPTSTKPKKDVFDSQDTQVSIDKQTVKAGQELLYKVTYKNTTGKDQKVVIKDAIPAHTKYVEGSADNNGVYENGVITWTKEKVAPGETFEVTFKVKVDENVNGEVIKNKANVLEGNNNYETNETTNPTPKKPGKEIPRTGFGANTALYTALLGLSTVALGGFRIRYKKKNNK